METQIKKITAVFILLFAFAFARAGFVPRVTTAGSCQGNDGIVVFNGVNSGILGPYTFILSSGNYYYFDSMITSTDTVRGLAPGSYSITMYVSSDYNGTAIFSNVAVGTTVNVQATVTNTTCPANAGVIALNVSGVSGTNTYRWSNGASTSTISSLPGGEYTVTVTNSGGCYAVFDTNIVATSSLSVSISDNGSTCNPVLTAIPTGATGSVSYTWSSGETSAAISSLSTGNYDVTVTDGNLCTATNSTYINVTPLVIDSNVSINYPSSCNASNGRIIVNMLNGSGNGTPPFSYDWSNGSTDSVDGGLSAAIYTVTVTDAHGCTASNSYDLTQNSLQAYIYANYLPTCGASDGSIEAYGYNGSGSYNYLWSNGSRDSVLNSLPAGQYGLTVTDGTGCSATTLFNLSSQALFVDSNNASTVNPSCTGNNGSITIHMDAGIPPYTFLWSNSATDSSITGLSQGAYDVTVTDSAGCTGTAYYYLYQTQLGVSVNILASPTCSASNGILEAYTYGGSGVYTYSWSNLSTRDTITNASTGIYWVTVTDTTGCTAADSAYVNSISSLQFDSSAVIYPSCHGSTGAITANVLNGTRPYSFHWSTGATDSTITGLSAGQYAVTVTDGGGCSGTYTYSLYQNPVQAYINYSNQPTCSASNGGIEVYAYGGNGNYSYLWSNSDTGLYISNIAAGVYTVTITDCTGCTATLTDTLTNSNPLQVYVYNYSYPTCGASDGYLFVQGYNGSGNYSYQWSNRVNGDTLNNLPAGTYSVTVSDGSTCTASLSFMLFGQSNFSVSVAITPTACDSALQTGSATAIVTGSGTPPYSYTWYAGQYYPNYFTPPVIGTSQTISNLGNEVISVNVTDSNGCVSNSFNYDSIVIPFDPSCYDHIAGYVYLDSNGNCILDPGEQGVGQAYIWATGLNGQTYYANPYSNGFYDIQVLPGTYTVQYFLYNNSNCTYSSCTSTYTDSFSTIGQISTGNNFGISAGSSFDLGVHMGYIGSAPGTQKEFWVYYYNWGPDNATAANLYFTYDTNLTLVSTTPPYTSINTATHTLTWSGLSTSVGYFGPAQQVVMYYDIPATLSLGTLLYSRAEIDPIVGDCDPTNNTQVLNDSVSDSHDPNSKQVSPAGNLSATDTVLTYTVRFQNTGNAPATLVIIKDTLSPNVNPATVVPGASSAPYKFSMSGNGVLTFTFEPINLPDSASSPLGSQGFVMYTVRTKSDLPLGSQINNTAYVYFDANAAVLTNTTTNVRSNFPNGIANITNNKMTAEVVPNPAHDMALIEFNGATGTVALEITDELGNIITATNVDTKSYTLYAGSLAPGIYFYTAKDAIGNKATGKISVVR